MQYGRYEIQRELGRGSMGVVYLAHDPQIDRFVALKVLREDRLTSEAFLQRFLREARAMGRLSPHPHIVTVYDVGRDHGTVYIAMEYLEGEALSDLMRSRRLSLKEILDLGIQVAETLDYAHRKGIVHRDIKPSNIIMMGGGQVKITDFGIAHIEDPVAHQQTQAGEILGTPVYMSPEQVMGGAVDGRSDLYSLGVILYELAAHVRPFTGENLAAIFRAITQDAPEDPAARNPQIPAPLVSLIMKALSKPPEARFQSGMEMAGALRAGGAPPAPAVVPQETGASQGLPHLRRGRPTPLLIMLILAVIAVAGGVAYHLLKTGPVPNGTGGLNDTTRTAAETPEDKEPPKARLVVESAPEGALVFVDQAYRGETPLGIDLPEGVYEVMVEKPGFHAWEAQVTLTAARETPLSVRLLQEGEPQP